MIVMIDPEIAGQSPEETRMNVAMMEETTRTMRAYYAMVEGWIEHAIGCGIPLTALRRTQETDHHDRIYRVGDDDALPLIEAWIEYPSLTEGADAFWVNLCYRIHPKLRYSQWPSSQEWEAVVPCR